jgi:hypothetical protein
MTTIYINEKTTKGKKLLDFIHEYAGEEITFVKSSRKPAKIVYGKEPSIGLLKSINEAKSGKFIEADNVNDLLQKLKK